MTQYQWQLAEQPDPAADEHTIEPDIGSPAVSGDVVAGNVALKISQTMRPLCTRTLVGCTIQFALHDMDKAVARILEAIEQDQKITIYGDYDVDGLTSSCHHAWRHLQSLGAEPDVFIPDRFTDGYGPNAEVYTYLQKTGTQLVITVDNGVAGAAVIDPAQAAGMDVVVTDHHELPANACRMP